MLRLPKTVIYQQKGAVLVVSVVVLLVLTLIGITSLRSTALERKMAGNIRDVGIALQSSESGLRDAENYIESLTNTNGFGTTAGLYAVGTAPDPFNSSTWTSSSSMQASTPSLSPIPRYFIEYVGDTTGTSSIGITSYGVAGATNVMIFRIVSRGQGPSGTSQVLLEVFYGKLL